MRVFLFLIFFILDVYLSGCAGCSNSEKKERHSKNDKEKPFLPTNDTLSVISNERERSIEESAQIDSSFQSVKLFKVIAIIDGDTYDILSEKNALRIRMDGIDAPERGMPYNKVSKKYLSDLIFGKFIQVKIGKVDHHGRIIGQASLLDGTDISLEMIRAGLAWHYKEFSSNEEYAKAEDEARDNKLGLWQDNNPIPPWNIRKLHRNGISTKELFKDSRK